jgi:hypothetical protein
LAAVALAPKFISKPVVNVGVIINSTLPELRQRTLKQAPSGKTQIGASRDSIASQAKTIELLLYVVGHGSSTNPQTIAQQVNPRDEFQMCVLTGYPEVTPL